MITIRRFAPGEVIVREHERGETAFILASGRAEMSRESAGKRIAVRVLEAGAAFGEMSLVDDSPRGATVTALEEATVREFHRDGLLAGMREDPASVLKLLGNIFDRLREANLEIARLARTATADAAPPEVPVPEAKAPVYEIEGLTPRAVEAISGNPFTFTRFPLKIGRRTHDPLVDNHLEIEDQDPLQISRHHVSIVKEGDRLGVVDRGSHLGAMVDDTRIGGKHHDPGPVYFKGCEGILVLGTDASPYRYRIAAVKG